MKYQISLLTALSIVFIGCNQVPQIPQPHVPQTRSNFISPDDENLTQPLDENETVKQVSYKPPKKHIKLKKVEDTNFSPEYMYPTENKTKTEKETIKPDTKTSESNSMTITECVSMIGQERFDKYTQLLGNEDAALKRCQLIKAQS